MKYLLIFSLVFSSVAFAGNQDKSVLGNNNNINNCNPTLICKVDSGNNQKQRFELLKLKAEIEKLKKENQELKASISSRESVVIVKKEESKKNAISLIGAESQTGLNVTNNPNGSIHVNTAYQTDAGLMYQRDFSDIRGSIGVTLNGTAMLGVGLKF